MAESIEINTKNLDKLLKAFKGKLPVAKVGILKDTAARSGDLNNPTIGAKHEFGLDGMPVRSFLRMPIIEKLSNELMTSGAIDDLNIKKVIQGGTILPWIKSLGALGVKIVLDAFSTGGFGKWPASNMSRKKVKQTLVETGQLRNSITWEVT